MKPIAKGRAVIIGSITTAEPRAGRDNGHDLQAHERAMLVVFDSMDDFRKAVQHGAIDVQMFAPEPKSRTIGDLVHEADCAEGQP